MANQGSASGTLSQQVLDFFEAVLPQRPDYEQRPQQLSMALAVARALEEGEVLVAEAGTGTGKSLAYLVPALLWSLQHGQPVVVSTRTLNLQQQLLEKDIPLLRQLWSEPFRATIARGWSNYLCRRRLEQFLAKQAAPELTQEALQLATQVSGGAQPIRQKLSCSEALWGQVQADSTACNRNLCPHFQGCGLFVERRELQNSQLIVANHSLVLADLALRLDGAQGILPAPAGWVLDEGHHLEEVANRHLGRSLSRQMFERLRQSTFDPDGRAQEMGWLPGLRQRLARSPFSPEIRGQWLQLVDDLLRQLPLLYQAAEEFFFWLQEAVQACAAELRITVTADFFHSAHGERCQQTAQSLAAHLENCGQVLRSLVQEFTDYEVEVQEGGLSEVQALHQKLGKMRDDLEFCLFPDSSDWVYWAGPGELGATPLDIGQRLASDFFEPARSVVLTSATLAVSGQLSFYEQRVGLGSQEHRLQRLVLESPFAYQEQAYLGVATDLGDPNRSEFWRQCGPGLAWLFEQLGGRSFLLGTSFASLRLARDILKEPLEMAGIQLLMQGQAPASLLIDQFRANPRSVLLGADSFWEGVDVPGDALQCIVMTRLPFRVPTDPLVAAHCRRLEEEGQSSFSQYQLPQAILKFRQGFGRLIRTQRDKGCVLVLDSRLYNKGYGNDFLAALPKCRRRAGKWVGVVQDAVRWLQEVR